MKITPLDIPAVLLIEPRVFEDGRGYFFESFNRAAFQSATGNMLDFVQDNESLSKKGVLRGLHLQRPPHEQGKLVRVVSGSVFDVAVDLRKSSPHYGKWCGATLSATNKKQLFIPPGFAHGFAVLENDTVFSYKCTGYYNQDSEVCLAWNDPDIGIDWPLKNPVVSEKDSLHAGAFATFKSPF